MYTDYTDEENSEYNDYYDDNGNDSNNNIDKEKIKKIAFFVLAFVVLIIVIILVVKGCSGKRNTPTGNVDSNQTPSVSFNRESYSLEVGEEVEIYADVMLASIDNPIIGWQTEDSNVVMVEDLGSNKALIRGVSEGETNIVAIYRENGRQYSNKCQIIVTSKTIKLEKIDIVQENISLSKGKSILLQVKLTPENAKVSELIYTSDNTNIASVSEDGMVNAINYGTTTIVVKTGDGTLSDSVTVNVVENGVTVVNPTSIQLGNLSNGLKVGGTATIDYTVYPTNATNKNITWSSTNPGVATINSNGIITGISAGTTTIVAATSNGISASREITVASNTIPVSSIAINGETSITMNTGGYKRIFYTITPSNATNQKVTFTTSNRNIVIVDSTGGIGARSPGVAIITVTTDDGKKYATLKVTVIGSSSTTPGTQTGTGTSSGTGYSSGSDNGGTSSNNSNVSCNDSMMTYITHNGSGKGAIISQYGFDQAKPFQNMTEKPVITITGIADCINLSKLTYKVVYGTTSSNVATSVGNGSIKKVGDTITLNNGDGYYRIELTGYLSNSANVDFRKSYYAIVQNNGTDTVKPYVNSISVVRTSSSKLTVTTSINETGSGLKNVKYCLSSSTITSCTPNIILFSYSSNYPKSQISSRVSYINNGSLSYYKKICVNATDASNNVSTYKCVNF